MQISGMHCKRRHDIDWIRVLAFDVMCIYHIGMFFNHWDSQVKNNLTFTWLTYPMQFSSVCRLPPIFVVSGMGTRFALSYRTGGQYIKERFIRLFIPLIVGMNIQPISKGGQGHNLRQNIFPRTCRTKNITI